MGKKFKKAIAGIMATALGVSVLASSAFAVSLPDFSEGKTGSLTIHKYQTDADYVGGTGTGGIDTVTGEGTTAKPLANVTFAMFKVGGTDAIGTAEPTYDASKLEVTNPPKYDSIVGVEQTTDSTGTASFTNLELGRYLVVETKAPASVVTKSAPFFVDIPMTRRDGENAGKEWLYDVNVYPKNVVNYQTPDVDKSITSIGNKHESVNLNEDVEWIISSAIPSTVNDYNKYELSDVLDSKISYVENSISVKIGDTYDTAVSVDSANYDLTLPSDSDRGIKVAFKEAYLGAITEIDGTNFYVSYKTTVDSVVFDTNGNPEKIVNSATVGYDYTNRPSEDTGIKTLTPENTPEVHTGGLKFTKVSSDNTALQGAEFKIATSLDNAKAGVFMKDKSNNEIVATSDAQGYVSFTGLKYGITGKAYNDTSAENTTTYYVVETKAPQGYVLAKEPKAFVVGYGTYTDTNAATSDYKFVNISEMYVPSTGSVTSLVFMTGGIAVLALAGVLIISRKAKKD